MPHGHRHGECGSWQASAALRTSDRPAAAEEGRGQVCWERDESCERGTSTSGVRSPLARRPLRPFICCSWHIICPSLVPHTCDIKTACVVCSRTVPRAQLGGKGDRTKH